MSTLHKNQELVALIADMLTGTGPRIEDLYQTVPKVIQAIEMARTTEEGADIERLRERVARLRQVIIAATGDNPESYIEIKAREMMLDLHPGDLTGENDR